MTDEEKVEAYVQAVHRIMYGRFIDDIDGVDGQEEVEKIIGWTNELIEELEREADWHWVRENEKELGTIATASQTFSLPADARKLVVEEHRPLVVKQGDSIVSIWDVVEPNQITNRNSYSTRDKRVTYVNGSVVFSREFNDQEIGGKAYADVINDIPELTKTDATVLELVKPQTLLKYGAAKNATLPDIVQGGLSPSFAQKYDDLLEKAKDENKASSTPDEAVRDDYSHIGGVY